MEWLNRLLSSKPTVKPQQRCGCGRFCKSHDEKPDATARLVKDMSAAGLYVPPKAIAMVERLQGGAQ
jgi:hypothetical protein